MLGIAPGPGFRTRWDLAQLSGWWLLAARAALPSALPRGASAPCLSVPPATAGAACVQGWEPRGQQLRPSADPCPAGTAPGEEGSLLRLVEQRRGRRWLDAVRVRSVAVGSCVLLFGAGRNRGAPGPSCSRALVPGEASPCCRCRRGWSRGLRGCAARSSSPGPSDRSSQRGCCCRWSTGCEWQRGDLSATAFLSVGLHAAEASPKAELCQRQPLGGEGTLPPKGHTSCFPVLHSEILSSAEIQMWIPCEKQGPSYDTSARSSW